MLPFPKLYIKIGHWHAKGRYARKPKPNESEIKVKSRKYKVLNILPFPKLYF